MVLRNPMTKTVLSAVVLAFSSQGMAGRALPQALTVYVAEDAPKGAKDTEVFEGKELVFKDADRPLTLNVVDYTVIEGAKPAISFSIADKDAKALNKITAQNKGKRLAIVMAGSVIQAAVVREAIDGHKFQLSFNDQDSFEKAKEILAAK